LSHAFEDFTLNDVRVLDLFAGTGALGLEALSRGAAFALFVDHEADARGAQRENIEALGVTGQARLFRRDALKIGKAGNMGKFGLVFLDPPYGKNLAERTLVEVKRGDWLEEGALCVIEEKSEAEFKTPEGFTNLDERRYGNTKLIFLRATRKKTIALGYMG
jgi:16S rRNA (guanine966-N2)-methyltransferase